MRKSILLKLLVYSGLAIFLLQSCKDDGSLRNAAPIADQSFVQEFDTLAAAKAQGWVFVNRSSPIGSTTWAQGPVGSAYSSKATSTGCIYSDFNASSNTSPYVGIISNFAVSPSVILQNDDKIIFYTRTATGGAVWGDRLQVLINPTGDGYDAGSGTNSGVFSRTLLDINPLNATNDFSNINGFPPSIYHYDPISAFPETWTRFEAKVAGLSQPTKSRFALRHYVPSGGPQGIGNVVYVDSVAFVSISHK